MPRCAPIVGLRCPHEQHAPSALLRHARLASDIERHAAWLHEDAAMGFDRIYLHNVARGHQERFITACGERLLPELTHVY